MDVKQGALGSYDTQQFSNTNLRAINPPSADRYPLEKGGSAASQGYDEHIKLYISIHRNAIDA